MKKSLKALAVTTMALALAAGSVFAVSAAQVDEGQWCQEESGWWYKLSADGSVYVANTWYNIKDSDGTIKSYYFDEDGWLLVSGTTPDGYTTDENGCWTVDGVVQVMTEDDSYSLATVLEEAVAVTESASTDSSTSSSTGNPSATKVSGGGDSPVDATFSQTFAYSTISGSVAANAWSNFQITLPGTPTTSSGDNTDWYYEVEDVGMISCAYYPISKYGSADITTFITGFMSDVRGFGSSATVVGKKSSSLSSTSSTNEGTVEYGGITFTLLKRTDPSPSSSSYCDYCYIREVPGTGMVQVLIFDYYGAGESWSTVVDTITTVS